MSYNNQDWKQEGQNTIAQQQRKTTTIEKVTTHEHDEEEHLNRSNDRFSSLSHNEVTFDGHGDVWTA